MGLERIVALINPDNVASERTALALGMAFEKQVERPGGKLLKLYQITPQ
jgi:RimJ/RimL family protein N-acetyltransferase